MFLSIDNCLEHPYVQDLFSVKVVFLSPSATAVLHPVDTVIIESCTVFCS
jgi:hypothetical protein